MPTLNKAYLFFYFIFYQGNPDRKKIRSKKGISHPSFYGVVINKAKKLKSIASKLVKSLKNLVPKEYDIAIILHSLRQVYFSKKYRQSVSTTRRSN